MFLSLFFISFAAISSFNNVSFNKKVKMVDDVEFSSLIDPEECYSVGKAYGDIGIYPDREYKGSGIKIGILENGIPANTSDYNLGGTYGTSFWQHSHEVSSVLGGDNGIANEATFYFASKHDYDFINCLRWLVETAGVDVINHSGGYGVFSGSYSYDYTAYVDNYIKDHNVIFVNAIGNYGEDPNIAASALGINVISAAMNEKDLSYSLDNSSIYDDYDTIIDVPTAVAPGIELYGFDTQTDNANDSNKSSYFYNGTSYSAPMVTGIIALLLEEFNALKGHPETIQAILRASMVNGVVNYQMARRAANNYLSYSIPINASANSVLINQPVVIPYGKTLYANNYVLFNGLDLSNNPTGMVPLSEIKFSKCKLVLESFDGIQLLESTTNTSNVSIEYLNTSSVTNMFRLKVVLNGFKALVGVESACLSFHFGTDTESFSLTYSNMNLDTRPTFYWTVGSTFSSGSASIVFYNYKDQIVLEKNNLNNSGNLTLSLSEWHDLLSLRGREFYVYLKAQNSSLYTYYSSISLLSEPKTFGTLYNINPEDYSFLDAYNNTVATSTMTYGNINISIERLRCGYIQQQYINLSSKKTGAGHAYLQLTFNTLIKYCAFGVTLWRDHELSVFDGDTAVIEIMNSNGIWSEYVDLLNDLYLPDFRKDIIRMDAYDIKGIRFDITSTKGGDRNKGRLCIDNISFTDSTTFTDYLCCFTEPIVVREDFSTPNT